MKLFWAKTGDFLSIDIENQEFVEYWLDQIFQASATKLYETTSFCKRIDTSAVKLLHAIDTVNLYLEKFKLDKFKNYTHEDISQYVTLNEVHNYWTYLCAEKKMGIFFSKNMPDALDEFNYINVGSHTIEKIKTVHYSSNWRSANKFDTNALAFGIWNVSMFYEDLGKSHYHKWLNFDTNFSKNDTSNYVDLTGTLEFHLGRAYSTEAPKDYADFCNKNSIELVGNVLPIGNFKDVDKARKMFYTNSSVEHNYIQIDKD